MQTLIDGMEIFRGPWGTAHRRAKIARAPDRRFGRAFLCSQCGCTWAWRLPSPGPVSYHAVYVTCPQCGPRGVAFPSELETPLSLPRIVLLWEVWASAAPAGGQFPHVHTENP